MRAAEGAARPIRSFVAIEVEDPARAAIVAYLAVLRENIAGIAWTPPENLHVTLKFLGSVAPERLHALAEPLATLAAAWPTFVVTFTGVGAFPGATRPRVLWIGAHAPELEPLARGVDVASIVAGLAAEDRPYHPHVTLGRVRATKVPRGNASDAAAMRAALAADRRRELGVSDARALVLFRSDTGPAGARHTPLARFAFRI
jgi:RNA 2',3'-cyclic 3'-phosphodiesterase